MPYWILLSWKWSCEGWGFKGPTCNFHNCFMECFYWKILENCFIIDMLTVQSIEHTVLLSLIASFHSCKKFIWLYSLQKSMICTIMFSFTCLMSHHRCGFCLNDVLSQHNPNTESYFNKYQIIWLAQKSFESAFLFLSHSLAKRLHMHYPFKRMEWQCQSPDRKNEWNK